MNRDIGATKNICPLHRAGEKKILILFKVRQGSFYQKKANKIYVIT